MSRSTTGEAATWREGRRQRAWELFQMGWRQRPIATALGVSEGAVSQWLAQVRRDGPAALKQRPRPGRPPCLSPAQQAQVPALLGRGATAFGFRGDRWTCPRVAEVIRREFGVRYHPDHVSRLLDRWGFSRQKPIRRARQRDEAAIQEWREQRYPALVKRGHASAPRSSS
jgi:transposase